MAQCKFSAKQAFTEDGILIFNIKALFDTYATIQQIKNYFKKFGTITNIRLLEDRSKNYSEAVKNPPCVSSQIYKLTEYEIQYEKSEAAARALRKAIRYINYIRVFVEPCHSFEQPDGKKILFELNKKCSIIQTDNNIAPITTLNDDCLEHICKFLSIQDQINFAITCRRFRAILILLSKAQHRNFNLNILQDATQFQIRIFLKIVGPQIKSFSANMRLLEYGCGPVNELTRFLGTVLVNVETLKMSEASAVCELIDKLHYLQELKLVRSEVDDESLKLFKSFKHLKKLTIIDNTEIKGAGIPMLTGLEQLTLYDCPNIVINFNEICKNLKNLNYLDIRRKWEYDSIMDTEHYEHIAKYLLQLKTLKISCKGGNYNCLAHLPELLNLVINYIEFEKTEEFLACLAKHQANQLEEIFIRSTNHINVQEANLIAKLNRLKVLKCSFPIDDKIMEAFSNMKNLEEIEIIHISGLTDDAILKLLENCLKIKRISLFCESRERPDLIRKSCELLEKLRKQGCRTACVHLAFVTLVYSRNFEPTAEKYVLSDVLEVTDEAVSHEYNLQYLENPDVYDYDDDDDSFYQNNVDFDDDDNDDFDDYGVGFYGDDYGVGYYDYDDAYEFL